MTGYEEISDPIPCAPAVHAGAAACRRGGRLSGDPLSAGAVRSGHAGGHAGPAGQHGGAAGCGHGADGGLRRRVRLFRVSSGGKAGADAAFPAGKASAAADAGGIAPAGVAVQSGLLDVRRVAAGYGGADQRGGGADGVGLAVRHPLRRRDGGAVHAAVPHEPAGISGVEAVLPPGEAAAHPGDRGG